MTEEDLEEFHKQMDAAQSNEERQQIRLRWMPHMARCMRSTNTHIKAIEKSVGTQFQLLEARCEEIHKDVCDLGAKVDRLHETPKWKDNKMEWLKANWVWVVVMLYIAQSLLGLNVASLIERFFGS